MWNSDQIKPEALPQAYLPQKRREWEGLVFGVWKELILWALKILIFIKESTLISCLKSSPTWLTLTSWPRGQRWRSTRGRWGRGGGQGCHFGQGVHQVVRRHLLHLHLLGSHDGGGGEHLLRQPHLIFPQARIYRGSEQETSSRYNNEAAEPPCGHSPNCLTPLGFSVTTWHSKVWIMPSGQNPHCHNSWSDHWTFF